MLKKDFAQDSAISTRYDGFIGTKAEVEAKIKELNLKDLPEPKEPIANTIKATNTTLRRPKESESAPCHKVITENDSIYAVNVCCTSIELACKLD